MNCAEPAVLAVLERIEARLASIEEKLERMVSLGTALSDEAFAVRADLIALKARTTALEARATLADGTAH